MGFAYVAILDGNYCNWTEQSDPAYPELHWHLSIESAAYRSPLRQGLTKAVDELYAVIATFI